MLTHFLIVFLLAQVSSLLLLWIGSQIASHRWLMSLGKIAHRQKIRALDRYWPLTLIRPAVARGDQKICAVVLTLFIVVKSAACFVTGIVSVFWLPFASLIVPSIIAVHDPNNPKLESRIHKVAMLQITSHVLAAAIGFAVVAEVILANESAGGVLRSNVSLVAVVLLLSSGFAIAAGKSEASGLMEHGI